MLELVTPETLKRDRIANKDSIEKCAATAFNAAVIQSRSCTADVTGTIDLPDAAYAFLTLPLDQ